MLDAEAVTSPQIRAKDQVKLGNMYVRRVSFGPTEEWILLGSEVDVIRWEFTAGIGSYYMELDMLPLTSFTTNDELNYSYTGPQRS